MLVGKTMKCEVFSDDDDYHEDDEEMNKKEDNSGNGKGIQVVRIKIPKHSGEGSSSIKITGIPSDGTRARVDRMGENTERLDLET